MLKNSNYSIHRRVSWSRHTVVFCDIDKTLIYGVITDFMHIVWEKYKSDKFLPLLMGIQAIFGVYNIVKETYNTILQKYKRGSDIYFVTARKPSIFTKILLYRIFKNKIKYRVAELGCDHPADTKLCFSEFVMNEKYEKEDIMPTGLLIEDNKATIDAFRSNPLYDIIEVEFN